MPAESAQPTQATTLLKVFTKRVSVDVVVTDNKGKPVQGFQRSDFKVYEDGKLQPVRSFDFHVLDRTAVRPQTPPGLKLPPNTYANLIQAPQDGPVTVILYDVLNTPIISMPYAHEAMVKFIKEQRPGSRTAIFVLGDTLRMLEGFTDDETRLLSALNSKSAGTQQSTQLLSAANSGIAELDPSADTSNVPTDPAAVAPSTLLGDLNSLETMENQLLLRERIDATAEAFAEIARFLAVLPGRKNLLWLSGSFPGAVLPDSDPGTAGAFLNTLDSNDIIKQAADLLTAAHVAVYPVDVRGLQTDPVFSAASNAKVTPGVSPKSTFNNQLNAEHSTMDLIAADSGGHAFYNTNGLRQAMDQAIEQGSMYYALTYAPTNTNSDGTMRKIKVELDKPGYQLSYRKNYFADDSKVVSATPTSAAPVDPLLSEMKHGAPISTQLFFEATVLPLQGVMTASAKEEAQLAQFAAPLKKREVATPLQVQHYEVTLSVLGRQMELPIRDDGRHALDLNLAIAAFDADGLLQNGLEIEVKNGLTPDQYDKIHSGAYRTKLDIALPLEARWLRIAVRDAAGAHTGTIEIPVAPHAAAKP